MSQFYPLYRMVADDCGQSSNRDPSGMDASRREENLPTCLRYGRPDPRSRSLYQYGDFAIRTPYHLSEGASIVTAKQSFQARIGFLSVAIPPKAGDEYENNKGDIEMSRLQKDSNCQCSYVTSSLGLILHLHTHRKLAGEVSRRRTNISTVAQQDAVTLKIRHY